MEYEPQTNRPLGRVLREVSSSFTDMVRSEVRLAKCEIQTATHNLSKQALQIGLFGFFAALGILPLLAFFVVGLGTLIDNYWLSSLIVAIVCFAVGGGLAYRAYSALRAEGITIPRTRQSLQREAQVVENKVQQVADAVKRRAA